MDFPGPGLATTRHPTSPVERLRVGWGGGGLQPTAASLAGEGLWVMENGKIINRPKKEKKISNIRQNK